MNRDEILRLKKQAALEAKKQDKLSKGAREALRQKHEKEEAERRNKKKEAVKLQKTLAEEEKKKLEEQMEQEFLEKIKLEKAQESDLIRKEKEEKERTLKLALEQKQLQEEKIRRALAKEQERLDQERNRLEKMTDADRSSYLQSLDSSISKAQEQLQAQMLNDMNRQSELDEKKNKEKQAKMDMKNAQKAKLVYHQQLEKKLGSGYNLDQDGPDENEQAAAYEADVMLAHKNNLKAFKRSGDVL
ncbi:hypothetical protein XU18_4423 [Perkinsela sp. CCAP 1560/4]|nr:hypothetical protein XU18_4423 [Perkinsela sp. CCAP 1560/4]|eukprot:KNH04213.1 hypothetical protein XU18_4423 [Perkinsela sp. CCAP 1560/4]